MRVQILHTNPRNRLKYRKFPSSPSSARCRIFARGGSSHHSLSATVVDRRVWSRTESGRRIRSSRCGHVPLVSFDIALAQVGSDPSRLAGGHPGLIVPGGTCALTEKCPPAAQTYVLIPEVPGCDWGNAATVYRTWNEAPPRRCAPRADHCPGAMLAGERCDEHERSALIEDAAIHQCLPEKTICLPKKAISPSVERDLAFSRKRACRAFVTRPEPVIAEDVMRTVSSVIALSAVCLATPASAQQLVNLTGRYQCTTMCGSGAPGHFAFVTQNGWNLNLVTDAGMASRAWVNYPGRLWIDRANMGAIYSPTGLVIQFDNGTIWRRAPGVLRIAHRPG